MHRRKNQEQQQIYHFTNPRQSGILGPQIDITFIQDGLQYVHRFAAIPFGFIGTAGLTKSNTPFELWGDFALQNVGVGLENLAKMNHIDSEEATPARDNHADEGGGTCCGEGGDNFGHIREDMKDFRVRTKFLIN